MSWLSGWIRIALVDLRGDLRRFGVLLACLALGTSTIAAVGSVGAVLQSAIISDATKLMGGDLEAHRSDRRANPEEIAYLRTFGKLAEAIDSNGRAISGDNTALLDIYAVDMGYPLVGSVVSPQLKEGESPAGLLAKTGDSWGVIIDPLLEDKLGIGIGGHFQIGSTDFVVNGLLTSLPDGAARGFHLGVSTIMSVDALVATPDARPPLPGILTFYRYKVLLNDGPSSYPEAAAAIKAHFNDKEWETREPRDAAGDLAKFYDLFTSFLLIVGLSALLVGGVGVSNAVTAYIAERQRSIATLRSLGATSARIMVHFLVQILMLSAVGVGIGVLIGAVSTAIALPALGKILAIDLNASIHIPSLLIATAFGMLIAFAFAFLPLVRAQKLKPAMLFRSTGGSFERLHWSEIASPGILIPLLLVVLAIMGLAWITTKSWQLVVYYSLAVLVAFLLLRFASLALQAILRLVPPLPLAPLRNAFVSIYRPGSTAPAVIMSLGLGLSMLLIVSLLDYNVRTQLTGQITRDAPTFVGTDLFDDEVSDLQTFLGGDKRIEKFSSAPMLRGTVTAVNGVPVEELRKKVQGEAQFLLQGMEIPMTFAADMPANSTLTDGEWWPADYAGEPLISLRTRTKNELGIKVGDTFTIDFFGDTMTAKVGNFRDYQWQNGLLNFAVTISPGAVEDYPYTYMAAIKTVPGEEKNIERVLSKDFTDLNFIPIGDALSQVAGILTQLSIAVSIVGGLAVVNGLFVLAGTMAAGRKQREADAVVMKVLGATRGNVIRAFMIEYGILGALSAALAAGLGILGAYTLTKNFMEVEFSVDAVLILEIIFGAVILTILTGAATTWQSLSTRPAQYLRSGE